MPPVTLAEEIQKFCAISSYAATALRGECFDIFGRLNVAGLAWSNAELNKGQMCRLEKSSHSRRVISFPWTIQIPGREPVSARLYAKRARSWRLGRALISPFRASKSRREFETGLEMLKRGVRAPLPLLYAEKRGMGGILGDNYLVTLGLEGAESFYNHFARLEPAGNRIAALEALARFVREGYAKGFFHDDCSTHHIFVEGDPSAPGADERMSFIDVDNCGFPRRITEAGRVKNAFQLFRSMPEPAPNEAEKAAFLRVLLEQNLSDAEARRYLNRIERFSEWKIWQKRIRKGLKGKFSWRGSPEP